MNRLFRVGLAVEVEGGAQRGVAIDELLEARFQRGDVKRAVDAGVKKILIADPERSTFFDMARRCEDKFYAEIIEWRTRRPVEARGSLMVLENA